MKTKTNQWWKRRLKLLLLAVEICVRAHCKVYRVQCTLYTQTQYGAGGRSSGMNSNMLCSPNHAGPFASRMHLIEEVIFECSPSCFDEKC